MAHRQWQDNALVNKGKNEAYLNYQKKYEQMTKQQQLIEQKKQEIQKRLEEKKKKETEEALKKLSEDKLKLSDSLRSKRGYGYSKTKQWPGRDNKEESSSASLPKNIFSNDGSFFEQFQKISGVKVKAKKRSISNTSNSLVASNGVVKNEQSSQSIQSVVPGENKHLDKEEKRKERRWSSPERIISPTKPQMIQQHPQMIQLQQVVSQPQVLQTQQIIQQQGFHPQQHQPPLQQQVFLPQKTLPPPILMNFPPHFSPMQCGMMLPPPMTPSSIPPPAPLNPGSIPSPSPLQPCSIPSPSPLQPYAIPPPSPLIPHSIPPPSPMVPHSIPPPSPLTPHSIPPPLPLRPQSIPPPLQRPSMFLSMVPPPPPPPPEEKKIEVEFLENTKHGNTKIHVSIESDIETSVKSIFRNDDYSSEEEEKEQPFGPCDKAQINSDSESELEPEHRSSDYCSDKESYDELDHKIDSLSGLDSNIESKQVPESESDVNRSLVCTPVIVEDTQTQFPSDTKDSSNTEDSAPADSSSSEGNSLSQERESGPPSPTSACGPADNWQDKIKKDPNNSDTEHHNVKNQTDVKDKKINETDQVEKVIIKEEVPIKPIDEIKPELEAEILSTVTEFKIEEPPVKKKRRSRWADKEEKQFVTSSAVGPIGMVVPTGLGVVNQIVPPVPPTVPTVNVPGMAGAMISKVTRTDSALVAYAMKAFGHTNLTDSEWKKAEDHYKINLLYQDMMRKKAELERLEAAGKHKYEYDSDEETEGGTWEHKLRSAEMEATQLWADELTEQAKGKHHIGDFLPPDELARFMEKYEALKEGREPDLSDYKEFKLKEDNIGFQMLQKLGWTEGQGLGPDGSGIMDPVNKSMMRAENQGLGVERPEDVDADDDEYDAYRKRMMLAYRFRPNPMNNPRRPYY